jgi:hypothetical protein
MHAPHPNSTPGIFEFRPRERKTAITIRREWRPAVFSTQPVGNDNLGARYNFLSTFSGTRYVTRRAITATIGVHS